MADPTKYVPGYDFSAYQAGLPNKPLPADRVDIELADIANAIGGTVDAIKDIRRADGALKNGIVTSDSVAPEFRTELVADILVSFDDEVAAAVLASLPAWRGPWLTATAYGLNDLVSQGGSSYICVVAHTSGTFATDLSAVKWQIYAAQGGGDMLKVDNLSGLVNTTTAQTNLGGTTVGRGVFTAANATAAQTAIGGTTVGRAVFSAADAAAAQTAIGGTTVGRAVLSAADATAAQTAIGGTTVGRAVLSAADAVAAQTAIGGTAVGRAVLAAADAAAGRTALGITAPGAAPMFGVRAWGRVTSGGVLSFGGNIASVTKSGILYKFTFLTALPTANYLVMAEDATGTVAASGGPYPVIYFTPESGSFSTTGFAITSNISSGVPGSRFQFVVIG